MKDTALAVGKLKNDVSVGIGLLIYLKCPGSVIAVGFKSPFIQWIKFFARVSPETVIGQVFVADLVSLPLVSWSSYFRNAVAFILVVEVFRIGLLSAAVKR